MAESLRSYLSTIIDDAAASVGYTCLRDEQKKPLHTIVSRKDVFVSLPTGYGKSLCYALLPFRSCRKNIDRDGSVTAYSPHEGPVDILYS